MQEIRLSAVNHSIMIENGMTFLPNNHYDIYLLNLACAPRKFLIGRGGKSMNYANLC